MLVVLIGFSAFFSASETALTAFRKVKIKDVEKDNPKAAKLLKAWIKRPNEILASLLLGNTIVNIFAASVATLFFVSMLKICHSKYFLLNIINSFYENYVRIILSSF